MTRMQSMLWSSNSLMSVIIVSLLLTTKSAHAVEVFPIAVSDWQVADSILPDGTLGILRDFSLDSHLSGVGGRHINVNDSGQVLFTTHFPTYSSLNPSGASWMWEGGVLSRLAATSDAVSSSPYSAIQFGRLGGGILNEMGDVVIGGTTNETSQRRFLKSLNGSFEVKEFDSAPNTSAGTIFGVNSQYFSYNNPGTALFTGADFNDQGESAFFALLDGPDVNVGNDESLWSTAGGSLHLIAREGQATPEFGPQATLGREFAPFGTMLDAFDARIIGLNNKGQSWFSLPVLNGSVQSATFVSQANGTLEPLIFDGASAGPGLEFAGSAWFGEFSIGEEGEALFYAPYRQGNSPSETGLWHYNGNDFKLVVQSGAQVPGLGPDTIFSPNPNLLVTAPNADGQFAFSIPLKIGSSFGSSVWRGTPDDIEMLLLSGSPAPGIDGGATFASFDDPALINERGQIVVHASYRTLTDPSTIKQGYWLVDLDGQAKLIATEGSLIALSQGDSRTIRQYGIQYIAPQYLSNSMFVFHAVFEDGTTALLGVSLIPEPTSIMLATSSLLAFALRRHR